jgi:hypothetical protein
MSGTSASTRPQRVTAAVGLPVPRIYLVAPNKARVGANPAAVTYTVAIGGEKLQMQSMPYLSASEIPKELFDRDLRLELLRYSVKKGSTAQKRGRSGYKHPTHLVTDGPAWLGHSGATPVAPSLPTSKHRGGSSASGLRMTTEWAIASADSSFLIDTLGDFYYPSLVSYFDTVGNNPQLAVHIPSDTASRGYSAPRQVFGYSPKYRPNYFRFRFSVSDPTDPRNRIVGPYSETVVMAPSVHPFIQDVAATQTLGRVAVKVNSNFNPLVYNTWLETRLPGTADLPPAPPRVFKSGWAQLVNTDGGYAEFNTGVFSDPTAAGDLSVAANSIWLSALGSYQATDTITWGITWAPANSPSDPIPAITQYLNTAVSAPRLEIVPRGPELLGSYYDGVLSITLTVNDAVIGPTRTLVITSEPGYVGPEDKFIWA